jgi:hypothetical protein
MTDFKKGGPLQNSNIFATNRLFVKNKLFKKRKKKRAPGVYNPKAKFKYEDGGEKDYIELDLSEEDVDKYVKGGYIVEEVSDPSIATLNRFIGGGALEKLKPGGAPCPRGQYRDNKGNCVSANWNNIQAADSYTGMYGGYDEKGVKNLSQYVSPAKKGKKFSDYILRGGKTRTDVAKNIGKTAGQYFGMPGEALEPTNYTKAGLDRYYKDIDQAKKSFKKEEKDREDYEKARKKAQKSKDPNAGSKFAREYEEKGWNRFDTDVKEGRGPDPEYSAKEARQAWGDPEEWKKFNDIVGNVAAAIPLAGAAGALGGAGAAILENPYVQAGLTGYGLYDATTNTLPEAYKDLKEGNYWEAAGNTALAGLDLVPGIGLAGKGAKLAGKGLSEAGKSLINKVSRNAYSLPNKGLGNLDDATDAAKIEFQGSPRFDYQDVPEVLSGLRQRGQNLDELGAKGTDLLHPDMINYHGTYAGRPIVEVKMPDGSSEMFYKSSGWAGKQGAGTDGTTAGMWQVFGGHAKSPSTDNWFIKDYGYTDYYGSNTYKDMAENMNDALMKKYGFNTSDDLDNAFNFQNRFGSTDSYTPPLSDPSFDAYYKSKNVGTNTSTGLTDADIAAARAEEEAWLNSHAYIERRMRNTGETVKQVKDDVARILKRADKANYNVNANLKDSYGVMTSSPFINPRVAVDVSAPNPKPVLRHENIHLYSPASGNRTIFNKDLHKGWDKPNVADLPASERGVYANYPTIGDAPNSIMYPDAGDYNYNMLGYEQQARHLGVMRDIAKKNNVDLNAGEKLTEKQVRDHMDEFIKTRKDVDYDYDSIWGAEIYKERERLAKELGKTFAELEVTDPAKYKEIINLSKDNAAKTITNALNKAWVVAPTVGVAGTAAMLANPFQGSDGLQQQKKGGSTNDYIEIDIPEKEIQKYIDQGYIVEPVSKLKKFIS